MSDDVARPASAAREPAARDRYLRAAGLAVTHGFTTRLGGTSGAPFASLNLGLSSGDERGKVEANRDLLLAQLGFARGAVCAFDQVHGDRVLDGRPGWFEAEADAAVSDDPEVLLVVSVADCLPVLFHDPESGAVGAAHCGWRGTVAGLAAKVVGEMAERFGSRPEALRVALGPGIAGACYQVGPEVVERFAEAGFPEGVIGPDEEPGRARLDIPAANRWLLERAGVPAGRIEDLGRCTHCEPDLFYSYRRDDGRTGRHWAFISAG